MDSTSRNKASCSAGKTGCCEELTGSGFSCSGTACLDVGDGCAVVGQKSCGLLAICPLATANSEIISMAGSGSVRDYPMPPVQGCSTLLELHLGAGEEIPNRSGRQQPQPNNQRS